MSESDNRGSAATLRTLTDQRASFFFQVPAVRLHPAVLGALGVLPGAISPQESRRSRATLFASRFRHAACRSALHVPSVSWPATNSSCIGTTRLPSVSRTGRSPHWEGREQAWWRTHHPHGRRVGRRDRGCPAA